MKTELYTNCELLRVPVKAGAEEVYLPQNVDWVNRKIEKLIVCAPDMACIDPIDGVTPVMDVNTLLGLNCYVSLYDADNNELMHDVSVEQLLHYNNHPLYVNAKLNLSQCKLSFMTAPAADATILMYIFYTTRTEDYFDFPKRSITCTFPLAANQELTLQEIINTYVHALPAKIEGIICWNAATDPAYLSLRDYALTYQMANIHTEMMRDDMNNGFATDCQAAVFLLNDLDIDFDYSHIREAAGQNSTQKITFLYK